MSSKKINWRYSGAIATRIADKAFEHLITPLEKQLEEIVTVAARADLEMFGGIRRLVDAGFLKLHESLALVTHVVRDSNDEGSDRRIRVNLYIGVRYNGWDEYTLVNDELYEQCLPIETDLRTLRSKREELCETLRKQLEGKTVAAAIKAWPEARSIIEEVMEVEGPVAMTQPLEQLLARFLPMLAAPADTKTEHTTEGG